MTVSELGLYK